MTVGMSPKMFPLYHCPKTILRSQCLLSLVGRPALGLAFLHLKKIIPMKKIIFTLITLLTSLQLSNGQTSLPSTNSRRIPTTALQGLALPFFDARHGAMGDAGVATSPDYVDIFWNPAKTAFAPTKWGFYSSYTPWLTSLFTDMYLSKIGVNYKLPDNRSAISLNFTLFNQGLFQSVDPNGQLFGTYNPREWALGLNYAKKLSPNFSMGIGLKYLNSSLYGGVLGGMQTATTIAADISIFHQNVDSTKLINLNYGIYISNLSGRISYGGTASEFIPTNLKIGIAPTLNIDKHNTVTLAIDANKLMVPTPVYNASGGYISPSSAIGDILGSFSDAPDGLNEELQEIIWSMGLEYWYDKKVAIRIGKFIESENKGGRNFTTFGVGVKIIKRINVDLAYMQNEVTGSPIGNLWRGNITFGIGKMYQ